MQLSEKEHKRRITKTAIKAIKIKHRAWNKHRRVRGGGGGSGGPDCLICSLGQHFSDIKGSKYMLVHSVASKYARYVIIVRLIYWTPPPPSDHWTPLFKSDDLLTFF